MKKKTARSQKPERGGRNRPPLERMKKIFGLLQDGKYPNSSSVAAEFGVAVKTARRDFDFMRDRWELPIEYDEKKFGFYFAKPVDRFPGVPVTEKELFALCVAHKAIEQYKGTALQQPLELAFQKCMGQLDDQERFTLQNLDDVLSFRPFAPEDPDLRLFEIITEAIRERRALQFEYRNPAQASRQNQETVRTKSYTVPTGSRLLESHVAPATAGGAPVTNATALVISAPMAVTEHEETRATTELGAAQKDTARELSAKLASLKGIVWVGVAMFLFGLASIFYPPVKLIIGSVTTSAAITVGGLALIVLPTVIVGNEMLIMGGVAAAVGLWFLAHRHGQLRGLVDAANNSETKGDA